MAGAHRAVVMGSCWVGNSPANKFAAPMPEFTVPWWGSCWIGNSSAKMLRAPSSMLLAVTTPKLHHSNTPILLLSLHAPCRSTFEIRTSKFDLPAPRSKLPKTPPLQYSNTPPVSPAPCRSTFEIRTSKFDLPAPSSHTPPLQNSNTPPVSPAPCRSTFEIRTSKFDLPALCYITCNITSGGQ